MQHLLALDYQVWEQNRANELFAATRRAMSKGNSALSQSVQQARFTWVSDGVLVPAFVAYAPLGLVEHAMANITRGLCMYYLRLRLATDTECVIRRWYDLTQLEDTLVLFSAAGARYFAAGDGSVFDCRVLTRDHDPEFTFWIIHLLESAFFTVSTHASGSLPRDVRSFRLPPTTGSGRAGSSAQ